MVPKCTQLNGYLKYRVNVWNCQVNWARCWMSVMLAVGRQNQEFKVILGYLSSLHNMRPCCKQIKNQDTPKNKNSNQPTKRHNNEDSRSQEWWLTSAIPVLGKLKSRIAEFGANIDYVVSFRPAWATSEFLFQKQNIEPTLFGCVSPLSLIFWGLCHGCRGLPLLMLTVFRERGGGGGGEDVCFHTMLLNDC